MLFWGCCAQRLTSTSCSWGFKIIPYDLCIIKSRIYFYVEWYINYKGPSHPTSRRQQLHARNNFKTTLNINAMIACTFEAQRADPQTSKKTSYILQIVLSIFWLFLNSIQQQFYRTWLIWSQFVKWGCVERVPNTQHNTQLATKMLARNHTSYTQPHTQHKTFDTLYDYFMCNLFCALLCINWHLPFIRHNLGIYHCLDGVSQFTLLHQLFFYPKFQKWCDMSSSLLV